MNSLFDMPAEPNPPALSPDRRRTMRALDMLEAGRHPLCGVLLHADAAPVADRKAPGARCGNCGHLTVKSRFPSRWLKCGTHVTAGPATDIRAWWPACAAWVPVNDEETLA